METEEEDLARSIIRTICHELFREEEKSHSKCLSIIRYWLNESALPFEKGKPSKIKRTYHHVQLIVSSLIWAEIDFELCIYKVEGRLKVLVYLFRIPVLMASSICGMQLCQDFRLCIPLEMFGNDMSMQDDFRNFLSNKDLNLFANYEASQSVNGSLNCKKFKYNNLWDEYVDRKLLTRMFIVNYLVRGVHDKALESTVHEISYQFQKTWMEINQIMIDKEIIDRDGTQIDHSEIKQISIFAGDTKEWQYDPAYQRRHANPARWTQYIDPQTDKVYWKPKLPSYAEIEKYIAERARKRIQAKDAAVEDFANEIDLEYSEKNRMMTMRRFCSLLTTKFMESSISDLVNFFIPDIVQLVVLEL